MAPTTGSKYALDSRCKSGKRQDGSGGKILEGGQSGIPVFGVGGGVRMMRGRSGDVSVGGVEEGFLLC